MSKQSDSFVAERRRKPFISNSDPEKLMTYHNAVKYLLSAPDDCPEEIVGNRLRRLWSLLGNPQNNLKYLRLA